MAAMRICLLLFALAFGLGSNTCGHARLDASSKSSNQQALVNSSERPARSPEGRVDFATQVKPILEARCQPCHFAGGVVYQRLPFDRQETITTLGTKLFTRIKDEKEKDLITAFLSQQSSANLAEPGGK